MLQVRRRWFGEDHPDTASSLNNLAQILRTQGKYAEAEALLRKALAIRLKAMGEDHPETARAYGNLAANLESPGRVRPGRAPPSQGAGDPYQDI